MKMSFPLFSRGARNVATFAVGAAIILSSAGLAPAATAVAATNGWAFTGQLSVPARDGSGVIPISGRLTVPACPDQARGCWLAVHRIESGPDAGWQAVTSAASPLVYRTAGVYDVTGSATLTAGTWEVGVVAGISPSGSRQGSVIADGLSGSVIVPGVVSTRLVTRSSSASVVLGEAVSISAAQEVTWSDAVVTDRPVTQPAELFFRQTGSGTWSRVGQGSSSYSVAPPAPGEYRMLISGTSAAGVYVGVIRPTSAHRIADPVISATSAIANSTLEMSSTMATQYDDGQWRLSPAGTRFELQFLAEGAGAWARLYSNTVSEPGILKVQFPMLTTGRYRFAAGNATSLSVLVTEITPTSVVAIEPLELPAAVDSGDPIDISTGVEVGNGSGEWQDPPDGTEYVVDFAPMPKPTASGERAVQFKWRKVKKGKIRNGEIRTRISPTRSGYWRIRVLGSATEPAFVRVR